VLGRPHVRDPEQNRIQDRILPGPDLPSMEEIGIALEQLVEDVILVLTFCSETRRDLDQFFAGCAGCTDPVLKGLDTIKKCRS